MEHTAASLATFVAAKIYNRTVQSRPLPLVGGDQQLAMRARLLLVSNPCGARSSVLCRPVSPALKDFAPQPKGQVVPLHVRQIGSQFGAITILENSEIQRNCTR